MSEWTYTRLTTLPDDVKGRYSGLRDTEPDDPIEGDFYVYNGDDESIRRLTIFVFYDHRWMTLAESGLTNAQKSEIAGIAQKDVLSNIEAGSVSASDYGYFNTIIAGTVNADFVSGIEGEFRNLHITGESSFDGDIVSDALETRQSSKSSSLDITAELKDCLRNDGSIEPRLCFQWSESLDYSRVFTSGRFLGSTVSENSPVRVTSSHYFGATVIIFQSGLTYPNGYIEAYGDTKDGVTPPNGWYFLPKRLTSFTLDMSSVNSNPCCRTDLIIPKTEDGTVGGVGFPFKDIYFGQAIKESSHGCASLGNELVIEWGSDDLPTGSTSRSKNVNLLYVSTVLFGSAGFGDEYTDTNNQMACGCDFPRTLNPQIRLWAKTSLSRVEVTINWFVIGIK